MDDFKDFWLGLTVADRQRFATACDTTPGYIRLILASNGRRKFGESLAMKIERETGRRFTVEQLRPDVPWEVVRGRPRADQQDAKAA